MKDVKCLKSFHGRAQRYRYLTSFDPGKLELNPLLVVLGLIGVLTISISFPQEGVGDTADSYAYDGHRVRKWNMATGKYGEVGSHSKQTFYDTR